MPSLKAIRKRISSVKSTQQITKAMKMVSAAKLRRAQDAATAARPYSEKLSELLRAVAARVGSESHPLLATPEHERTIDLLLVTSDRGLCGGFNANLIRKTEAFVKEHPEARVRLTVVGRKGYDYFKKRSVEIAEHHINLFGGPSNELATKLAGRFAADFAAKQTDGVYILYSHFRSAISQVPTIEKLLPLSSSTSDAESLAEYIYEPNAAELLDRLLRQYIVALADHAFLESVASEHGARMTAMDSATSNARDMIDRLTLAMNRARQAAITTELMEIVSGAEALKG
jgi:F-type H+-transporting ATPase subunit gamma